MERLCRTTEAGDSALLRFSHSGRNVAVSLVRWAADLWMLLYAVGFGAVLPCFELRFRLGSPIAMLGGCSVLGSSLVGPGKRKLDLPQTGKCCFPFRHSLKALLLGMPCFLLPNGAFVVPS